MLRKAKVAKGVEWELDPDLMKHYGENCRELGIILLDDDLENVFPTCYAWWTATERKCWGDGENAIRRTQQSPNGEPWLPCGPECDDLREGRCKPSGDLRFVLSDFPRLGSVARIHTSSYRSVRQIHSALQEIQGFTGGRLAGLTASLIVRPEEGTYRDKDGKKKSTTIWALSLEVHGPDMKKLMGNLTENASVFIAARKLLGGHVLEVVEDETEQGAEVTKEFYPPEPSTRPGHARHGRGRGGRRAAQAAGQQPGRRPSPSGERLVPRGQIQVPQEQGGAARVGHGRQGGQGRVWRRLVPREAEGGRNEQQGEAEGQAAAEGRHHVQGGGEEERLEDEEGRHQEAEGALLV